MEPIQTDNEWGSEIGRWLIEDILRPVWAIVWRLGVWAIGWLVAGILIKFGFTIADYIMMWWYLQ
jgi:hypothetical protein